MEKNLKELRNSERKKAFQECEQNASQDLLHRRSVPKSIIKSTKKGKRLNPLINPGMTVRIWSTMGLVKNPWHQLQSGTLLGKTYAQHLLAELISSGPNPTNFSFGYIYGSNPTKSEEDLRHMFTPEEGVIGSPDHSLNFKIQKKKEKPQATMFKLVAIGLLTERHIQILKKFIASATISKDKYSDAYDIASTYIPTYRLLSFACPITSSEKVPRNCTSFIAGLFEDIIRCRNMWGISDPNVCESLHMTDENFGGCTSLGQLWSNAEDQLKHVMKDVESNYPEEKDASLRTKKRPIKGNVEKDMKKVRLT
jgi:hypothetical protein